MTLLREEFLNIDSESSTLIISNGISADYPSNPAVLSMGEPRNSFTTEVVHRISIADSSCCIDVICDETDYPVHVQIRDSAPPGSELESGLDWEYIAELSLNIPDGRLCIHSIMNGDVAEPIIVRSGIYRIRVHLGTLNLLTEAYILEHWTFDIEDDEADIGLEDEPDEPYSRLSNPERNGWCRLVLWPSLYAEAQEIYKLYK
ncbi:MAG: hypothetical protein AAGH78_12420 [Cyanobacteria bacterium P01_H01_bin.58]